MPDRYLDKFKSNNERKCSKFKETRQNALYLCERTVSKLHVTGETCPSQGEPLKLQLEIVEPRYKNQLKA